jgi:hypothetical protein
MSRFLVVSLLALLLGACSERESVSFIPASPLTPEEIEQATAGLRNNPEFADLAAGAASDSMFTYRVADIQQALKGIDAQDELVSFCSSVVVDGATRLVLLAPPVGDAVMVKSASCSPVEGGLSCGSVSAEAMAFYKQKDYFFALQDGVTKTEADRLMYLFENKGITNLPAAFSQYDFTTVTAIGKSAEIYRVSLGDRFCASCSAQVTLLMTPNDELVLAGEPQQSCN